MEKQGLLFVVSAPSGAGKTSLCKGIVQKIPNLVCSVSFTTRAPRPGEVHGQDYFFVDAASFRERIDKNDFIEWAEVHGNLYGTSRELLMSQTERGIDVLLDIDSQGAMTLKKKHNEGVYIYILPPSFDTLRQRLMDRKSDAPEEVAKRLQRAREEIWNYRQYYYLIVNREYEDALKELEAVILAERIKTKRMNLSWIEEAFIKQLNREG
jgi:guanylate kinase